MNKNLSGIYYIKNKINNNIYVGSSKNILSRKTQHYSELRGGYHENTYLQRAWNKYGEENFEFGVFEYVQEEDLLKVEQLYINKYYDYGINCYNLNPKASIPPIKCKFCGVYDLQGNLIKKFNSIRECSQYLNIDESYINFVSKNTNYTVKRKYKIISSYKENDIKPFISFNDSEFIYLLDEDLNILNIFPTIKDCCMYINGKLDRVECNKISQSLHLCYSYKKYNITYKKDYELYKKIYCSDLKLYKYILKFDYKGNLLEVLNREYGSKHCSNLWITNCKINTRLSKLQRNSPFRLFDKKYIFVRSDKIINHIKTNIKCHVVLDIETNTEYEFVKQKDAFNFLNISKNQFEKYVNTCKIVNNKYRIYNKTY